MIKKQLSLCSVQGESQEDIQIKILKKLYARRLNKINKELGLYAMMLQISTKKPKKGDYRWEGDLLVWW